MDATVIASYSGSIVSFARSEVLSLLDLIVLIANSAQGAVDILQKYPVPECDIWFIKFSCDFHYNAAAIGKPLYLIM